MPDPPEFMRPAALYFGAHWMEQCKQAEARADKAEAALAKERERADEAEARLEWSLGYEAITAENDDGVMCVCWHDGSDWNALKIIDGNINAAIDKAMKGGA